MHRRLHSLSQGGDDGFIVRCNLETGNEEDHPVCVRESARCMSGYNMLYRTALQFDNADR